MILVFDTETTGMIKWREPISHPNQPRVVQLGIGLYHPDGTELSAVSLLVDADYHVEPEAAAVHGIDEELLRTASVSPLIALRLLEALARRATLRVAHNINFDVMMTEIEILRTTISAPFFQSLPTFCTMQATTPICRLMKPNPRHSADYKWPKLSEAHQYFFGEPFVGAHDALSDVRACASIYFHLCREHGFAVGTAR